jgi:SAM-dependent methyltransferase
MTELFSDEKPSLKTVPKEKFILDATAGLRMMWLDKAHLNVVYLDKRSEVKPDIVGDFRNLTQFKDESFNLVVFDPPHDIRNGPSDPNSLFIKHFGWLEPETWQNDIKQGLAECYRVLAPKGVLIFKWSRSFW